MRKFMIERAIPGVGQLDACALAERRPQLERRARARSAPASSGSSPT